MAGPGEVLDGALDRLVGEPRARPTIDQAVHHPDDQEREHAGKYGVGEEVPAHHDAHRRRRAAPGPAAAPAARPRHDGGTSAAGAIVQNAPATSPDTNEQFLSHSPRGSHQATKCSVPPNCVTSIGRGRPQCSLSTALARSPGPSAMVVIRNRMARPDSKSRRRGRSNLSTSAATTGTITAVPTHNPMSRASSNGG